MKLSVANFLCYSRRFCLLCQFHTFAPVCETTLSPMLLRLSVFVLDACCLMAMHKLFIYSLEFPWTLVWPWVIAVMASLLKNLILLCRLYFVKNASRNSLIFTLIFLAPISSQAFGVSFFSSSFLSLLSRLLLCFRLVGRAPLRRSSQFCISVTHYTSAALEHVPVWVPWQDFRLSFGR